jgi:hypothetical protein
MKKPSIKIPNVTELLEKYVEWVAMALGVGFFGWMAWGYLINSPVSRTVNGQDLTPANVDQWVYDNKTQKLIDLTNEAVPPKFTVPDYTPYVQDHLGFAGVPAPATIASIWDYEPAQLTGVVGGPGNNAGPVVTQLPSLPKAIPLLVTAGQSTVLFPAPGSAQPATPAAAPANSDTSAAPAAPPTVNKDIEWATFAFSIPMAPLKDQWTKAFGPDKPNGDWKLSDVQRQTRFLDLTAYRSEKLPDGTWTNPVEVPRLANNVLVPYPPANSRVAEMSYDGWAANNADAILNPAFYQMAPAPCGTIWKNPSDILTSLISPAAAPGQPAPTDATGNNNPGAQLPGQLVATIDLAKPQQLTSASLPTSVPVALDAPTNPAMGASQSTGGTFNPAPAVVAGQTPPPAMPDVLVYLHDDSVVPGHTYRYYVTYKLRNPLFNLRPERVSKAAWVDQFDYAADMSDPTAEVTIPLKTYFCCVSPFNRAVQSFVFDVFTFANGIWQDQSFTVAQGDEIGGPVSGVDYSTGYSYVDGRIKQQVSLVTVVDDSDGVTTIRRDDLDAADRKALQQWVVQSKLPPSQQGGQGNPTTQQQGQSQNQEDQDKN